ncbi:hypothetical protein [Streptomyces sp. NPDC092370]|uniref:hypothetical protein n=1 Tax=Streptomyces sp. NPDC092370 TaxID=3366016 RepID=UPI0038255FE1
MVPVAKRAAFAEREPPEVLADAAVSGRVGVHLVGQWVFGVVLLAVACGAAAYPCPMASIGLRRAHLAHMVPPVRRQ